MYVYQNGKLYTQRDEKLVGVEIYSDKVLLVEGSDTAYVDGMLLTSHEVQCKFRIEDGPYIFPQDKLKGEVEVNATIKPIGITKRTVRKPTSK